MLLKASAGGGGKGMQVVRERGGLAEAIDSARRVAENAFGDGTLLIEKYVERPRHVEIQILGDAHGHLVHLFERECSIQRRHQKVLEESPSPALDDALRARMGEAALAVGRAIGYRNAGTVEFILAPDGCFYFLEVNTRLQVEHPVTELVVGLDLVRAQIRVAEGAPLDFTQDDLHQHGAAIEARLYAEDPANGFLPDSGRIVDFHLPAMDGLRVDSGVETGSVVGIDYDPMLAKIITHGADRAEALRRLAQALASLSVQGVRTNRAFLHALVTHPELLAGHLDTHFIETHMGDALGASPAPADVHRAVVAATLAAWEGRRAARTLLPAIPSDYRNSRFRDAWVDYDHEGESLRATWRSLGRGRFHVTVGGDAFASDVTLVAWDGTEIVVEGSEGVRRRARVVFDGDVAYVSASGVSLRLRALPRFPDVTATKAAGSCLAPMPGKIIRIAVASGDAVESGQPLVVMEAMKMEHTVDAPRAGIVDAVRVVEGDQVDADQVLIVLGDEEASGG